jgi:flagellar motility protein MotE (MotC chaperone)
MKRYLNYAGLFLASFLVINVGMYFFLSSTQPSIETALNEAADSTAAGLDSASVNESAIRDSNTTVAPGQIIEENAQLVEALGGDAAAPNDTAVTEARQSLPEEPAENESNAQQPETDPNSTLADNNSDYNEPAIEPAELTPDASQEPNPKELAKLAKLLEGMKPAEAAAIASRLGTEEIVALVMKMKDRKAAKMMAELPVDRAAQVAERMSELIAQRGTKS